jgi:hypothetical protein
LDRHLRRGRDHLLRHPGGKRQQAEPSLLSPQPARPQPLPLPAAVANQEPLSACSGIRATTDHFLHHGSLFVMTQAELNRAVANATGETVKTVRHLGFMLLTPTVELGPHTVDWDELDAERTSYFPQRQHSRIAIA